jgi:streptogramin lyase
MTVRGVLAGAGAALILLLLGTAAAGAEPGTVTEYSKGVSPKAEPWEITAGPDGNVWFTENGFETTLGAIARITPAGTVTEFRSGLPELSGPEGITTGADGNVWFTDAVGAIGRITTSGAITEFSKGLSAGAFPDAITAGPDGNLWFTDAVGRIGRITPEGSIKEYPLPAEWQNEHPDGIAAGPDGNLWFAEYGQYDSEKGVERYVGGGIGRISPVTGAIEEYPAPSGSLPNGMAEGPDGNMWFAEAGQRIKVLGEYVFIGEGIGSITPAGTIKSFTSGIAAGASPVGIATGADGNMWFAEYGGRKIGRISASGAMVTEFSEGLSQSSPRAIAAGPDGNLWFAQLECGACKTPAEVGSIVSGAAPALLAPPTVSGGAVAGLPQQCTAAQWSTWAGLQPATSLFALDGFRFMLDGAQVGVGQTYTPPVSSVGHALTCSDTVTYGPQKVTASATSAAVTVLAPPVVNSKAAVPPVLSGVAESASRWREGSRMAVLSRRHRPPVGSTFKFTLSEPASVQVTFTQVVSGRKVKKRCVAPTHGNAHRRPCPRTVVRGMLALAAHAGSDRIVFQGRLSRSRKLAPGGYTVTFVAVNAAGQRSQPRSLRFTIVR